MMKKFLLVLAILLLSSPFCFAYDIDLNKHGEYQKKVMEMGFGILNANKIDKRIIFRYESGKQVNAFASDTDKSVVILRGLLPYLDNDDELAGIISHEIAHGVDYYHSYFRALSMTFSPRKYEEKADKKAVDYMVNAGYNPIALITALNKIGGQYRGALFLNSYDSELGYSHPQTSRRLAYIYEYIYEKYPAYLAQNDYRTNIYYQNFLLTSRAEREKIRDKHLVNVSNKKHKKND